jgi:hypothetical protein
VRNVSDDLELFDDLFGGEKLSSLFNKTHGTGTSRTGIIVKAPEKRQSRFFKEGGAGALKFWGTDGKVTEAAAGLAGPNKPVMDEVFVLDTEYRMTPGELQDAGRDDDNGQRGVFASGAQLAAIKAAIKESGATSRSQLVGARLTLTRTGKVQKGDYKAWTWAAKIDLGARPVSDEQAFD